MKPVIRATLQAALGSALAKTVPEHIYLQLDAHALEEALTAAGADALDSVRAEPTGDRAIALMERLHAGLNERGVPHDGPDYDDAVTRALGEIDRIAELRAQGAALAAQGQALAEAVANTEPTEERPYELAVERYLVDRLTALLRDPPRLSKQEVRARALDAAARLMSGGVLDTGAIDGEVGATARDYEQTTVATADRYAEWIADGVYDWTQVVGEHRAFTAGYQEAIRRLRDRDRYETWHSHRAHRQGLPQRSILSPTASNGLAEYLEDSAEERSDDTKESPKITEVG